jgi:ribonuclease HI
MLLKVYTDGWSRGNPWEAGLWVYITDREWKALEKRYKYLGVTTNNVAEYTGALYGIKRARELGATQVELYMDSKLVIEQLSGNWKIKNEYLKQLAQDIKYHSKWIEIIYTWIPREQNSVADALSNKAMDEKI